MDKAPVPQAQYKTPDNLSARANLHLRFGDAMRPWHPWVFDQLENLPSTCRILEVGCGPGWFWRQNSIRIPGDWRLSLSDLSPGMVGEAKKHVAHLQTEFAVADVQALPFAANAFDAVIANHMLYHVPDRQQAIAEFKRVLAPGGRLYVSTIGEDHMQEIERLARCSKRRCRFLRAGVTK